jgi:hypothetical protein
MKPKTITIRCVVAGLNSNGSPDFYFVRVRLTEEEYNEGAHYEAAKNDAEENGYEAYLAYDERDVAGAKLIDLFDWKTAGLVDVDPVREIE